VEYRGAVGCVGLDAEIPLGVNEISAVPLGAARSPPLTSCIISVHEGDVVTIFNSTPRVAGDRLVDVKRGASGAEIYLELIEESSWFNRLFRHTGT
jgi:hypothetical protein